MYRVCRKRSVTSWSWTEEGPHEAALRQLLVRECLVAALGRQVAGRVAVGLADPVHRTGVGDRRQLQGAGHLRQRVGVVVDVDDAAGADGHGIDVLTGN